MILSQMNSMLNLLQLTSPALPLGAYSYSEGLEALVEQQIIQTDLDLEHWLIQELTYGTIRLEAAVMLRILNSIKDGHLAQATHWNSWLSASRDTSELRQQSWQMGGSLIRLLLELDPIKSVDSPSNLVDLRVDLKTCIAAIGKPCNYAVAFGIAGAYWNINPEFAVLGYLQSWVSNLIGAGVKLIPLGQTAGQKLLSKIQFILPEAMAHILTLEDEDLVSCSWGLGLASMAHETQYSRLFRS
ncbi:MAG: urease accessory protein UreF [Oscillatoriales cyanobacterium RM2_1_1]|nr:urease accessory protein UreF [Oscillatoriales cyanobacterium RM2_1_1]